MSESRLVPVPSVRPPPLSDREDDALMLLAAGGERIAFEVLAGRYLPRLSSYCAKFLGDPRGGDEVSQEVLLEVWSRRLQYRSHGRFETYLFTIARTRCLNWARAAGRSRLVTGRPPENRAADDNGPPSPNQLDDLIEQERRRQVRAALLALPAKLREAVLLRYDQGLEYAEIARIVGRRETTVRSRVFHALRRIRSDLWEEGT
jgi:RNA polymerase sigma-70 factor (ECF subfamily)